MAGPDPLRYTVIADDLSAVDWQAAEAAIDALEVPAADAPNSAYYIWCNQIGEDGWQGAASYQKSNGEEPLDPAFAALLAAADPDDIGSVRAVLRADLTRLRDRLTQGEEGEFWSGYECGGALTRVSTGVVLWAEIDMRHYTCPIDCEFYTLERLWDMGVLGAIPGLRDG